MREPRTTNVKMEVNLGGLVMKNPVTVASGTFAAGYLVLAISRLLLSREGLRRTLSAAGVSIWLFAELMVCVAVMSLAVWLFSGSGKLVLGSLAGDFLLYLIVVEIIPYAISYLLFLLHEEHDEVERLRALRPQLRANRKRREQLLSQAEAALQAAKALHDELEALCNPCVDFGGVYAEADAHIRRLLG